MENMNNQETQVQVQVVVKTVSKKELAMAIFKEMNGMAKGQDGKFLTSRKDIIQQLIEKCQMTKDGAATYIANFRRGYWDENGKVNKNKTVDKSKTVDIHANANVETVNSLIKILG